MAALDLDAYLARIRYDGPREPTLDVLAALQLAHLQAIAFENLDPLLDRGVAIDVPALEAKLVRGDRGGYCFEQNRLFHAALTEIGFEARLFGARVYIDRASNEDIPARTHLAIRVAIAGNPYLVDVGFGGQSPTGPLRLDIEAAQTTPHEPYRIKAITEDADHERFSLEAEVAGQWKLLYRFDLDEPPMIDMVVGNHYVATHPDSIFRKTLMVARVAPGGRHALLNDRLSFHTRDGETRQRTLGDAGALVETLRDVFGIATPDSDKLASVFARLKGA